MDLNEAIRIEELTLSVLQKKAAQYAGRWRKPSEILYLAKISERNIRTLEQSRELLTGERCTWYASKEMPKLGYEQLNQWEKAKSKDLPGRIEAMAKMLEEWNGCYYVPIEFEVHYEVCKLENALNLEKQKQEIQRKKEEKEGKKKK